MAKIINSLIKTASIYTAGGIISQLPPFLLLPILTRYLTPEDYGYVGTFQAILIFITPFVGVNVTQAFQRSYYDYSRKELSVYAGNCILILVSSLCIVSLIFIAFNRVLSTFFFLSSFWLFMIIIIAAFTVGNNALLTVLRIEKKAVAFSTFNLFSSIVNILISIVLVVYCSMGWQGRVSGIALTSILFGSIGSYFFLKRYRIKVEKKSEYLKDAVQFGLPLIPKSLSENVTKLGNRFFLNNLASLTQTGIFTVGYSIASIVAVIQGAFHQAWIPWLYEQLKDDCPDKKLQIVKFTYYYKIATIVLVLSVVAIVQWLLPYIVGDRFIGSSEYVLWIALGFAAEGMRNMMIGFILFERKTHVLMFTTIVSGILSLLLNYVLIKVNGARGAAHAMAASLFINYILTWWVANRIHPMPWGLRLPK